MSTGQESAALVPHFDTWLAHKFRADEVHQVCSLGFGHSSNNAASLLRAADGDLQICEQRTASGCSGNELGEPAGHAGRAEANQREIEELGVDV